MTLTERITDGRDSMKEFLTHDCAVIGSQALWDAVWSYMNNLDRLFRYVDGHGLTDHDITAIKYHLSFLLADTEICVIHARMYKEGIQPKPRKKRTWWP